MQRGRATRNRRMKVESYKSTVELRRNIKGGLANGECSDAGVWGEP